MVKIYLDAAWQAVLARRGYPPPGLLGEALVVAARVSATRH